MNCTIRLTEKLALAARSDLRRPHAFAYERVGFLNAKVACVGDVGGWAGDGRVLPEADGVRIDAGERWGWIVLPYAYSPVPDECYLADDDVGARIDGAAVRQQMQAALSDGVSVVHVHLHEHDGMPRFSLTDMEGAPRLLRALHDAAPEVPHAALILSRDSASAIVRLPGSGAALSHASVTLLGRPMRFCPVSTRGSVEEQAYG